MIVEGSVFFLPVSNFERIKLHTLKAMKVNLISPNRLIKIREKLEKNF
jgi:hypothetical protein